MRTITLKQNVRGAWFLSITSTKKIEHTEDFSTVAHAQRAFMTEGQNQPYAKMVLQMHDKKPLVVRKATPIPNTEATKEVLAAQLAVVRQAMRKRPAR